MLVYSVCARANCHPLMSSQVTSETLNTKEIPLRSLCSLDIITHTKHTKGSNEVSTTFYGHVFKYWTLIGLKNHWDYAVADVLHMCILKQLMIVTKEHCKLGFLLFTVFSGL